MYIIKKEVILQYGLKGLNANFIKERAHEANHSIAFAIIISYLVFWPRQDSLRLRQHTHMEGNPKMTKARRARLLILLLTLAHLTCAWASLPSRHETFPSTLSFTLLSPCRTSLADTTDTTDTLSPASPQVIGFIKHGFLQHREP